MEGRGIAIKLERKNYSAIEWLRKDVKGKEAISQNGFQKKDENNK